ncbi:MAG TPA: hypothetical protein VFB41_00745 [Solirubrobacteraceae bacterium]|nr:hypothetical protein [Solirubrobacteraceae bacterium]
MPARHRDRGRTRAIVLTALLASSATLASAAGMSIAGGDVTLKHKASGFSIKAPSGAKLTVRKGVYVIKAKGLTVSFSRSITSTTPSQFGTALLGQLGGKVVSRSAGKRQFTAEVDVGARRETFIAKRAGTAVVVTTGTSATKAPVALARIKRIASSARGGIALRPPKAATVAPLEMRNYRAPDGGATAEVPAGSDWQIESSQGAIAGLSTRGAFVLGYSVNIFLPSSVPNGGAGTTALVSPYLSAIGALQNMLPRLSFAQGVSDVRVTKVIQDAVFPTYTSSEMLLIDYRVNGKAWTGAVTVATDSPEKYGNFIWNFYYSGIGVPAGTSSAVGQALLRTWRTWNPSGAIAQRTQQARQLMNETNAIWQQTSEFRSQTADRQARDVGCLLSGYYHIEDNSRKYDLPPLPCGQIYTKN